MLARGMKLENKSKGKIRNNFHAVNGTHALTKRVLVAEVRKRQLGIEIKYGSIHSRRLSAVLVNLFFLHYEFQQQIQFSSLLRLNHFSIKLECELNWRAFRCDTVFNVNLYTILFVFIQTPNLSASQTDYRFF